MRQAGIFQMARQYFGFGDRLNFPRIMIFMSVFFGICSIISSYIFINLAFPENRYKLDFFLYIIILFLLACLLLKSVKISAIIVFFAFFEMLLGFSVEASSKLKIARIIHLIPRTHEYDNRYQFHPTLAVLPVANYVSAPGEALLITHNSKNLRGGEPDFSTDKRHIAIFGGSTTYDIGLSDGETWVDQLQKRLPEYVITNHGVPGYSTAEHLIQTVFYANRAGKMPDCSVYYVGWNDIRNVGLTDLDPGYANFHLISQFESQRVRAWQKFFTPSPFVNLIAKIFMRRTDTVPEAAENKGAIYKRDQDISDLANIFRANIRNIVHINKNRNIKTIFVGQSLNQEKLIGDRFHDWTPNIYDGDVIFLQEIFNENLKYLAEETGTVYIDPAIESFSGKDFLDEGHFSKSGAAKMAANVQQLIGRHCQEMGGR